MYMHVHVHVHAYKFIQSQYVFAGESYMYKHVHVRKPSYIYMYVHVPVSLAVVSYKDVLLFVLASHVAAGAEVKVEAFPTLPSNANYTILVAAVTGDVGVLSTCKWVCNDFSQQSQKAGWH